MLFKRPSASNPADVERDADEELVVGHSGGARVVSATVVYQSTPAHQLPQQSSLGSMVSSVVPSVIAEMGQTFVDSLPSIDSHSRVLPTSNGNTTSNGVSPNGAVNVSGTVTDDAESSDADSERGAEIPITHVKLRAADIKSLEGARRALPPGTRTFEPWLEPKGNPNGLVAFNDLPNWLRDNFYILTGYRPELSSYTACTKSIFYLHNESGNIWTHLGGAILFIALAIYTYAGVLPSLSGVTWHDSATLACFFGGALICLSCSGFFHTFCAHSAEVSCRWNKIDYVGIIFLIVGSFYPAVFYGFYCESKWQAVYLGTMTFLGALCWFFAVAEWFQHPSWRWARTSLFLALGCCGVIPLLHVLIAYGYDHAVKHLGLWYMVSMGLQYVCGAMLYGFRWPERQWPGKFDYVGQSHQIFHVLVVTAATCHWLGVIGCARYWHEVGQGRWMCPA